MVSLNPDLKILDITLKEALHLISQVECHLDIKM